MVSAVTYFSNATDAINNVNSIATGGIILGPPLNSGSIGSYTSWNIAVWNGPGPVPIGTFPNGFDLSQPPYGNYVYRVFPSNAPCFKDGTNILCQVDGVDTYLPIEKLSNGTLVKTSLNGYKKIEIISTGLIQNPGNSERTEQRLYKCSPAKYPELTEDLYITGQHSILVDSLTETQREQLIKHMGKIFVTDKKYRLIACVDERAEPFASEGVFNIWHLALENENKSMNYGIYVNGGLLVETCCINTLNKSNLKSI